MKSITYSNGYVGTYDDDIKVGDLVSTYNAGYHIVTSIEDRNNIVPVFHYTKMYNPDGTKSRKLKSHCDGAFVRRADIIINNVIKESQDKIKALEEILETLKPTP